MQLTLRSRIPWRSLRVARCLSVVEWAFPLALVLELKAVVQEASQAWVTVDPQEACPAVECPREEAVAVAATSINGKASALALPVYFAISVIDPLFFEYHR